MTDISFADFKAWKEESVTIAFMNIIRQRVIDSMERVAGQAGLDPASDNYWRGFIAGQLEVLDVSFAEEDQND